MATSDSVQPNTNPITSSTAAQAALLASVGAGPSAGTTGGAQPMVFMGAQGVPGAFANTQDRGKGGKGSFGRTGPSELPITATLTDAQNHWYSMSDAEVAAWAKQMYTLGYIDSPKDYFNAHKYWDTFVTESANKMAAGIQKTPSEMADWYAGSNVDALKARADAGPGSITTSNPVNLLSEGDVRSMANQIISQRLGRDATDAEVNTFFNTINAKLKADPGATTVTRGADGKVTSQVSTAGFNTNDAQQLIDHQSQNDPQYAAYQGATTLFKAAMGALGPIGGE